MPNLYIIAGCNGAGKTTASFTVLPEMLKCDIFINADEIARGLSPLNPELSSIEAGRIMLKKINDFFPLQKDFAFETTLSSRTFRNTIFKSKKSGYETTLIFFWLNSVELAYERVENRVLEGGHHVPKHVIGRRYYAGIKNLFDIYIPISDYWMIFDNSQKMSSELIAEGTKSKSSIIKNITKFGRLKSLVNGDEK
ncbi:Predicted ABC-type ATPase [Mariniphaga anaerophila]|uniref:Predicted ABC-type ATPase n=1 Tax=Mariniphaga anaerophila TaxID=1484053 RepID=A0A1M5DZJ7_9BACT|nr:zeta toxin family protein [Mariniphaga anaerophila]SHF72261.1 Predicted ABC-type ATPase [Mariniphaga anaerophila]